MPYPITDPVTQRNRIFALATVFFLLALYAGLPLRALGASPLGLLWLGLMVAGGVFAAMEIREFADLILPTILTPWYIRPHAFLFSISIITLINALYVRYGDNLFAPLFGPVYPPQPADIFVITAAKLLGIVILDWPRRERHREHRYEFPEEPKYKSYSDIPRQWKPVFKPFNPFNRKER